MDLPDLAPMIQSAPSGLFTHGDSIEFDLLIEEMGGFAAHAFQWELHLSRNSVYGDADDVLLDAGSADGLAANHDLSLHRTPSVPMNVETGQWFPLFKVDSANQVQESREGNNVWTLAAPFSIVPTVTLWSVEDEATEQGQTGAVRLLRTGGTQSELGVGIIRGGMAQNGVDYQSIPDHVTIPAGASWVDIVVQPIDDGLSEGTETVNLIIDPPGPYHTGSPSQQTVNLIDDDRSRVTAANPPAVNEGGSIVFDVSVSPANTAAVLVTYHTTDGTAHAGQDYTAASGTLRFEPGQTHQNVTVPLLVDGEVESDESFYLDLTAASNATIDVSRATATAHNSTQPTFQIGAASIVEGNSGDSALGFTVHLLPAATQQASVRYRTIDGTATAGSDYTASDGQLIFATGQTTATIQVPVHGDHLIESDEALTVQLYDAVNATLISDSAAGTIVNDDQRATVTLQTSDASASESGPDNATLAVTRDGSTAGPLSVTLVIGGTAANGTDYQAIAPTLVLADGQSSATITIQPIDDADDEPDETVTIALATSDDYILGNSTAGAVTILDNDAPPIPMPDLIIDSSGQALPEMLVPGETGSITGTLSNIGDATAAGAIQVSLYLLPADQPLPLPSDLPVASTTIVGSLSPGQSRPWRISAQVPEAPQGQYRMAAVVDGANAVVERDESNNATSLGQVQLVYGFGAVPGHERAVRRLAVNGITYNYTGAGWGRVTPGAAGQADSIEIFTDDSCTAVLSAYAGRGVPARLHDVQINGSARTVSLKGFNIEGDIEATGRLASLVIGGTTAASQIRVLGTDPTGRSTLSLTAGDVVDLSISSSIPIRSIKVNAWRDVDSQVQVITAPALGSLVSRGDLMADLHINGGGANAGLLTLRSAKVDGSVGGTNWDLSGVAGPISILGSIGSANDPWQLTGAATVRSLRLGDVVRADVAVEGGIGAVKAVRWSAGRIEATTLTSLIITGFAAGGVPGDFGANLVMGYDQAGQPLAGIAPGGVLLGRATINGWLDGVTWRSAGGMGSLTFGGVRDSYVAAGFASSLHEMPLDRSALLSDAASIRSLTISGRAAPAGQATFARTCIAAGVFGNIRLGEADFGYGGEDCGFAATAIRSYRRSGNGSSANIRNLFIPGPSDLNGDYCVRIV